jgi:hypothetical protein
LTDERDDLVARLRKLADRIDREVSRTKSDIEDGAFGEIELMREAADALEQAQARQAACVETLTKCDRMLESLYTSPDGEYSVEDAEELQLDINRVLATLDARAAAMVKVVEAAEKHREFWAGNEAHEHKTLPIQEKAEKAT